jgi:hypothetical protein
VSEYLFNVEEKNVIISHSHNFSVVLLASLVLPFLGLVKIQIRMQFLLLVIVVMDAGLPESSIALKYRKEPFNRK